MKIAISVIALIVATSSATFAGGHKGNSANAKAMADNIKTYGGNTARALRPGSGTPFEQAPGNTGWGNAGSLATGAGLLGGDYTTGGQVSKSGKK